MNAKLLQSKFNKLGARVTVRPLTRRPWGRTSGPVVIDIGRDRRGEYFDIQAGAEADLQVLDVQPDVRHLLLMVRHAAERRNQRPMKSKFLCGHDERHWFVAGVPESESVSSVVTAQEALKPDLVRSLEHGRKGGRLKRLRRRTEVFVRQGEWFFVPFPSLDVDPKLVLKNEPIRRGRGKPHLCENLYRDGGITVWVCSRYPNGLTLEQYRRLVRKTPQAERWGWRTMRRDPVVFVRGKVTHPDHATLRLDVWHRVEMNTENRSWAMAHVAFLD